MTLNRTTFFAYARRAPFGGRLTQAQVDGMNDLLDAWEEYGSNDIRDAAYIFAGVFHETGAKMVPVRETFAKTDAEARKNVKNRKYGKVVKGYVWYGRGRIQNTWYANYVKITEQYGIPASTNPDILLDSVTDAMVTVRGHLAGIWTGKRLADYFDGQKEDPVGARAIVNGKDKASLIASYYGQFLGAFEAASQAVPPADATPQEAAPDKPSLTRDATTLGAVMASVGVSAGFLGDIMEKINNPYALGALIFAGIGLVVVLVGRYGLAKREGV